jgi:hypothetical protein
VFTYSLDKVENGDTVSNWTEHGVAVGREEDVSLSIDGTAEVGELQTRMRYSSKSTRQMLTLKPAFMVGHPIVKLSVA